MRISLFKFIALASMIVPSAIAPNAQTTVSSPQIAAPGNLQLGGFTWIPENAKDAKTGTISNESGFVIHFSKSSVKNFYSAQFSRKEDITWIKHQELYGQRVDVALLKTGELIASFDSTTNFKAKPTSLDQWADFLVIVLTYRDEGSMEKPASSITQTKTSPRIPGNIRLLDGYTYQPKRGIDSWVGEIKRTGGITIGHDIGMMAGNAASRAQKDGWHMQQIISGDELWCSYSKEGYLVTTFVKSEANFFSRAQFPENLVDFFLMVMTYTP